MPFGSARERRSRTTYRPTVTPEGSTPVDTFTGTTSSLSRTAAGKLVPAGCGPPPHFRPGPSAVCTRPRCGPPAPNPSGSVRTTGPAWQARVPCPGRSAVSRSLSRRWCLSSLRVEGAVERPVTTLMTTPFLGTAVGINIQINEFIKSKTCSGNIRSVFDLRVKSEQKRKRRARFG